MATHNEDEGGNRLWRGMRRCCSARTMTRPFATRSRMRSTRPKTSLSNAATSARLERQMLRNLLHFGDRTVGEIAVTRGDIVSVPSTSASKPDRRFRRSRAQPPSGDRRDLDEVIGMIHIKDVFKAAEGPPTGRARSRLCCALRCSFRSSWACSICSPGCAPIASTSAIVVDEFGGDRGPGHY